MSANILRARGGQHLRVWTSAALLLVLGPAALLMTPQARAATFSVTKTADTNDGICNADCSLREAIVAANAAPGADTITFAVDGTFTLALAGTGEDAAVTGDLDITDDLTITGNGPANTIIEAGTTAANGIDRVLDIPPFASGTRTVNISGATIRHGRTSSTGLAIANAGGGIAIRTAGGNNGITNLTVTNSTITSNNSGNGNGGGIVLGTPFAALPGITTVTLTDSTVSGNTGVNGGGIACATCGLTMTGSTLSGNTATGSGGGVNIAGNAADVNITGSTFTGNTATGNGGGIAIPLGTGTVTANLNRFAGNAAAAGSGIANVAATVNAENTWWGCDGAPGMAGCDSTSGTVDADPRLDLRLSAAPDTLSVGGTSTLTADVTQNSAGAPVTPDVLEGLNVTFDGGALGTVAPAAAPISSGTAATTFTATGPGSATVSATLDNAPAETASITIIADTTAPTASLTVADISAGGGATHPFTVVYSDDTAVDISTLDNSDLRVTGPNGYDQLASFVSVDVATNGTPRSATYQIAAPGGSWDATDNGTYTIAIAADEVQDTSGNAVVAGTLGTFTVNISAPNPADSKIYLPLIVRAAQPDLIVSSVSLSPDRRTFTAGEAVTITVVVANQGQRAAPPFWVDLYLNPDPPPTTANLPWYQTCTLKPCYGMAWQVSEGLGAGERITLTSTSASYAMPHTRWRGFFAAGTTDLYVFADTWNPGVVTGAVFESNETNNRAAIRGLTVTGPNPQIEDPEPEPRTENQEPRTENRGRRIAR